MGLASLTSALFLVVGSPTHFLPPGVPVLVVAEDATPLFEMLPARAVPATVHEVAGAFARVGLEGPLRLEGWVETESLRAWIGRPTPLWVTPRKLGIAATLLPGAVVVEEGGFGALTRVRYLDPDGQVEATGWVERRALTGVAPAQAAAPVPSGTRLAARRAVDLLATPEGSTLARLSRSTPVWVSAVGPRELVLAVVSRPGLVLRGWLAPRDLEPERAAQPLGRQQAQLIGEIPIGEVLLTLDAGAELRGTPGGPLLATLPANAALEQLDRDATDAWVNVRTLEEVCVYGWVRASDLMAAVP